MKRAQALIFLFFLLVSLVLVGRTFATTVAFSAVSITSMHTCPLDTHTFVIAYHDETNDDFSFQIYDTNGTQILAETDVDTTSGGTMDYTSIGVSAFNSTTFVLGWHDTTDGDTTFAVYNTTGSLLSGPTDADTNADGAPVQVSCFNSTYFVIAWRGGSSGNRAATFAVYTSSSVKIAGPTNADTDIGLTGCVSVSAFNSTVFSIAWFDVTDQDATFAIYDSAGTNLVAATDMDTSVGASSHSVSVSALNSTYFVAGWYDYDAGTNSFAVYDSSGTLLTGPTVIDATSGYSYSIQVAALNSTVFVATWYDAGTDRDLSFRVYWTNGTALTAQTDIETWATAANAPFKYQSPCSQESATGITIYNANWIIAYGNTTTQAIWQAFMPNGTAWDGTIPAQGNEVTFILSENLFPYANNQATFQITAGQNVTFTLSNSIYPSWFNSFGIQPFPITMKIGIPDGLTAYMNSFWIATAGSDMHISALFVDNWLNYTIDSHGTQHIHNGTKPSYVYIDGTNTAEGDGWSYADGTTHLESTYNASLHWSGQNLEFSLSQAILAFAYNLLNKGLAFQVSNMINPSSTSYFWKAIGFQSTASFMPLASAIMNNAFGFLATGTVNLWDSMARGMSLGFQATDTIKLWDSSTMLKALGFQSSETLLPSAASTMNKALGFLTTNTLNVWDSMTKCMSLTFQSTDILHFFSDGTSLRASGVNLFENSGLLNLFGNLDFNKELGFTLSELPHFFDDLSMSKAINVNLFEVFEAVNIQGLMTMLGGTFVVPPSNLPLMLGAFGVIMSIVALSFVLVHKRKEEEEE